MPNYVIRYDLNGLKTSLQAVLLKGRILSVTEQGTQLYIETETDLDAADEVALQNAVAKVRKELFKNQTDPTTGRDEGQVEKKLG